MVKVNVKLNLDKRFSQAKLDKARYVMANQMMSEW